MAKQAKTTVFDDGGPIAAPAEISQQPPAAQGLAVASGPSADSEPPVPARQGDAGRPYCEVHNVLMVAYSSKPGTTHYKCPIDGCTERAKRARPAAQVPAEPTYCDLRACGADNPAARVAMVKDERLSRNDGYYLAMRCPKCGNVRRVPRPDARELSLIFRRRSGADAEDLAAR